VAALRKPFSIAPHGALDVLALNKSCFMTYY
jgi:hypothetical protein